MPISIPVKKATPKPASSPMPVEQEAVIHQPVEAEDQEGGQSFGERIDGLGAMQKKFEQAKAFLKEYGELLSKLQSDIEEAHEDAGPDDTFVVEGQTHRLEFGKQSQTRTLKDKEKVIELMGQELFLACATVGLKDIDQYLTGPQRDKVLEYGHGARSKKLVAKTIK